VPFRSCLRSKGPHPKGKRRLWAAGARQAEPGGEGKARMTWRSAVVAARAARAVRGLWPDRNPLRRTIDRIEAVVAGGWSLLSWPGLRSPRWPAQVRAPRHRGHAPRRSRPRNPVARVTAFGQSLITRSHAHLPPLHQRRHQPDPFTPGEPGAKVRTKGVRIPSSSRWEAGSGQVAVPARRRAAGNPADSVSQQSYERTPPQGLVPRQTRVTATPLSPAATCPAATPAADRRPCPAGRRI